MGKLTPAEVARKLRRHRVVVYRWLAEGRLRGEKFGTSWLIDERELARFQRSDEPPRRRPGGSR